MCAKSALLLMLAMGMAIPPVTAMAQDIEEVIVTARKREESILKVPVAETALSEQQLEQYATADLEGVARQVPDLLFGNATGAFGAQVSLRGVGTSTLNAAIDQSVSLNLDGLQVSQGLAYQAGMFDVAQVEVLKGPQALFFGKSSPGGVISLHSADPTDRVEVITRFGYELEANQKKGELIVSGPVTDTLKVRLATSLSGMDGFFRNDAVGDPALGGDSPRFRDFAPEQDYLVRVSALWNPTQRFDAKLKMNYTLTDINGDGGGLQYSSCPGGTTSSLGIPFIAPQENCQADDVLRLVDMNPAAFPGIRNHGTPFENVWQIFGSLEANYHVLDNLTLTSVSGYYSLTQKDLINGTLSEEAGPTLVPDNNFQRRDITEELRLTSDFSDPVNFTSGAFFQNGAIGNYIDLLGNTFLGLPAVLQRGNDDIQIRSYSAFGQVLWKVLPQVELAGGARWTYEERTFSQIDTTTGIATLTPVAVPKISSHHTNPEASVTYTPTDTLTVFGSYKQASKSGSFDTTTIVAPGSDTAYHDEGVKGAEAGVKAVSPTHALRVNVDGYYYNYTALQVGTNIVTPTGGIIERTLNAASARVYGIDLDGSYRVPTINGLSVRAAVNWNHARFGEFATAPCWGGQTIAAGCNQQLNLVTGLYTSQNLSGRPLVRAPDWSTTFGFDHETPVGGNMTLTFGSSTLYSSSYYTDLILRSDTVQRAYFKTDISVALSGPERRWEVALIGNDLNDAITTGNCVNAPESNGIAFGGAPSGGVTSHGLVDEIACNFDRGREVWLRFAFDIH